MQPELARDSAHLLYSQKDDDYFSNPRIELVELINRTDLKILEIGCGRGATGKRLLETGKAKSLIGIEMIADNASIARSIYDEVYVGDVERMTFDWRVKDFDCFVLGDVLEHLTDPWGLLKRLRPFLADDGIVVASVPNVKHWPVIANLILHDDWRYAESGVLDATHLRFFTRSTAVRLFSENGYAVENVLPYFNGRRYSIPSRITFGAFAGFLAERWLMRLRATGG
jgi:2-polyprenyl-3-methyl-5-hydroxy-6-metoxy-1,4-benzoquinol methylase